MREIKISKGFIAFVDDEDYERLVIYLWYAHTVSSKLTYAYRKSLEFFGTPDFWKKRRILYLHHEVLNFPNSPVDHIDRNGLNCQKDNLRLCTIQQNSQNTGRYKNNKSGIKGVSWDKTAWVAFIKVSGKNLYLGRSKDKLEAASLYKEAAIKYFGEFARFE